jgi:hypothetical protein
MGWHLFNSVSRCLPTIENKKTIKNKEQRDTLLTKTEKNSTFLFLNYHFQSQKSIFCWFYSCCC